MRLLGVLAADDVDDGMRADPGRVARTHQQREHRMRTSRRGVPGIVCEAPQGSAGVLVGSVVVKPT